MLRLDGTDDPDGTVSGQALWWPPTKIAGRYLAPFLGSADERAEIEAGAVQAGVKVEVSVQRGRRLEDLEPQTSPHTPQIQGAHR
jgi:hypothetical protein